MKEKDSLGFERFRGNDVKYNPCNYKPYPEDILVGREE
jgi:hypothetical protein